MSLAPFYAAPIFVKIHILAALLVATLTPLQFWGFRKGSLPHRVSGYIWITSMLVVAISSLWITSHLPVSYMGFSPIHLLSILAPISCYQIVRHARAGRMEHHRRFVIGLNIGFWVAGAFTFLPTRITGRIVFG